MTIRLGHTLETLRPTLHNGPGWRVGLWTQGCSLRCTERCLNPHLLSPNRGHSCQVHEVSEAILHVARTAGRTVEGITVLGGEPLDQAEALYGLLAAMREAGLTNMVYTGHVLHDLYQRNDGHVLRLLGMTDLLVDGPYLAEEHDGELPWRGSRNQTIHCLSSRYTPSGLAAAYQQQGKGYSIYVLPTGGVSVSGLQERSGAQRIERLFRNVQPLSTKFS